MVSLFLLQRSRNWYYEQKLKEAQDIADAVLDAEVKIGELMREVPKASGGDRRSDNFKKDTAVSFEKPKAEVIRDAGFTPKQVQRFQTLAAHPEIAEQAKENQGERTDICQKSDRSTIDTKKELARIAGVSHDTIAKVEKIEAKATPELKAAVQSGEKSISQAYQEIRREEKAAVQEARREENAEKIEQLSSPLDAQGLFQTIVIDPPWDWGDEGDVNQFGRATALFWPPRRP